MSSLKSIRDLKKDKIDLTGIVSGSVDNMPNNKITAGENTGNVTPASDKVLDIPKGEKDTCGELKNLMEETTESMISEPVEIVHKLEDIQEDSPSNGNKRERNTTLSVPFYKKEIFQSLLSKEKVYNNGNKPIIIDTELKNSLEILSAVSGVPASTIVNNLLNIIFSNDSMYHLNLEVTEYLLQRQKENINKFK
jgi:hypothetical protein